MAVKQGYHDKLWDRPRNQEIWYRYFNESISASELGKDYGLSGRRIYDIIMYMRKHKRETMSNDVETI